MVPGEGVRPIGDRVKESLFNILGADVKESLFLDLFAGTGSVGIEALSRGAALVTFLDTNARAIETIRANLAATGLEAGARVYRMDAFRYLKSEPDVRYDYVYIAPPQYKGLWKRALKALDANPRLLNPDAWVIVQIDPKEQEAIELEHLKQIDQRSYGKTLLIFYEHPGGGMDSVASGE